MPNYLFADILLPTLKSITSNKSYTYSIPTELQNKVAPGKQVTVPFGKKKLPGIIQAIHNNTPEFATKPIINIAQTTQLEQLTPQQLALIPYLQDYYLTSPHRISKLLAPKKFATKAWQPKCKKKTPFYITPSKTVTQLQQDATPEIAHTDEQQEIINQIEQKSNTQSTHLLWGPTGSGKTEIYKEIIRKLPEHKQALVLVPEISLTPQIAQYLYNHFGDQISIWHSKLNDTEKNNAWWRLKYGHARLVIGSRSACFLPFNNLGAIIIDEEHSPSYKQEQDPRYHAKTVCQWLSCIHQCPLILGTATPSLETFLAAHTERIHLNKLTKRISNKPMPSISIIDMREESRKGNYSIFSDQLQDALVQIHKQDKQALLFLNRRGYASTIQCQECGYSPNCNQCDISLTVHKHTNQEFLQCHLCSQTYNSLQSCPQCQSIKIKTVGTGTQQIEHELAKLIPSAKILRADRDTTSNKEGFQPIYEAFKNKEANFLIGTQMIAKGLHLPEVELVGVIMADVGLHIPDFRATETCLQTLVQVCGRAGRGKSAHPGQVLMQTLTPEHPVFSFIKDQTNLQEFYTQELLQRHTHEYPPFVHITKLTFVARTEKECLQEAQKIQEILTEFKVRHLGSPALIFKQHNQYHYNILLFINNPNKLIASLQLSPAWRIDRNPMQVV